MAGKSTKFLESYLITRDFIVYYGQREKIAFMQGDFIIFSSIA